MLLAAFQLVSITHILSVRRARPSFNSRRPVGAHATGLKHSNVSEEAATIAMTSTASAAPSHTPGATGHSSILDGENPSVYSPSNPVRIPLSIGLLAELY